MLGKIRDGLLRLDVNRISEYAPDSGAEYRFQTAHSAVQTALFTSNAVFAGTPLGYASGAACIAIGLVKGVMSGISASPDVASAFRDSALAALAGGASAFFPVAGTYVNAGLAGISASGCALYTTGIFKR